MKRTLAVVVLSAAAVGFAQRGPSTRPIKFPSRGTHGAVAAGSEYATEAGMRMYFAGGNAVDAGIASVLAASVTEFSHFGFGGEAPILVRSKDGKVHAIAGVGTIPKLATADFFRNHKLNWDEIVDPPDAKGMRDYGTKSFGEVVQPANDLADGFALDELRSYALASTVKYLEAWPSSKRVF